MRRLLVLEVNEMPRRVLQWWGARHPNSPLWQLAQNGTIVDTHLTENLPRDLYPSQSWASVGMGVPWEKHGVFWYGDPKPAEFPFYWQVAAEAGRSVGLVGVLHSSPLEVQCANPNFAFVVPDCFADEAAARPHSLTELQSLNLRLSRESARVAKVRLGPADARGLASFLANGVRPTTIARCAQLTANVARRAWNVERLRVGQALLLADVFERQTRRHDPDLAVLFTNHIASSMHRYWAASFPEDWGDNKPYDGEWRTKHEGELPFAMQSLDRIVAQMQRLARDSDRTLVLMTSMGQQADLGLGADNDLQAVVREPARFLAACGVEGFDHIRSSMVPQLTVVFADDASLERAHQQLRHLLGTGLVDTMVAGRALTLTYQLACDGDRVEIGGGKVSADEVGVTIEPITDHRSGRHSPHGLLVSDRIETWPSDIDALSVAPLLLEQLDVPPAPHHQDPWAGSRQDEEAVEPIASTLGR